MWGTNKSISFHVYSMSNYLIVENNHMPYLFFYLISYLSECSFNSLSVIRIHSSIINQESPHNPVSIPPSFSSRIPQIQTGWVYVCPMNESIFSFQHCLNFQLKMSTLFPDRSERPSITEPLLTSAQAHVSATLFMIILHYKACLENIHKHIQYMQ